MSAALLSIEGVSVDLPTPRGPLKAVDKVDLNLAPGRTLGVVGESGCGKTMAPVIVLFTTRVGAVILAESGLAFLGLGVPPPAPTWGGMLSGSGRSFMYLAPWLALAPGLCITIVVYAINVFGDALRDLLDPRMRGSR